MKLPYIQTLHIDKVRHLQDITIDLSNGNNNDFKHLILTGKNGSGKTSVLEALVGYLDAVSQNRGPEYCRCACELKQRLVEHGDQNDPARLYEDKQQLQSYEKNLEDARHGLDVTFGTEEAAFYPLFDKGEFVLAYDGLSESTYSSIVEGYFGDDLKVALSLSPSEPACANPRRPHQSQ